MPNNSQKTRNSAYFFGYPLLKIDNAQNCTLLVFYNKHGKKQMPLKKHFKSYMFIVRKSGLECHVQTCEH